MKSKLGWVLVAPLALGSGAVLAHSGSGDVTAAFAGFTHPFSGVDHVIAMVAVGLWAVQLGGAAVWALPLAFALVMTFGAALGMLGVPLSGVELVIALSGLALGLAVMQESRRPAAIAAVAVGGFGLFHGYAHGTELPAGANVIAYACAFVVATLCLHAIGIAIGKGARSAVGRSAIRATGAVIAAVGAMLVFKVVA